MSGWGCYRKKPVVIEAMQLVGTNAEIHAVYQWIEANTLGSFDPLYCSDYMSTDTHRGL